MITPTPRIALEEHFMAPGFEEYFGRTAINISPALFGRVLADFGERRLSAMDRIGVEKAVLSRAGPGCRPRLTRGWRSARRGRPTTSGATMSAFGLPRKFR